MLASTADQPLDRPTVLVVDDDPVVLRALAAVIEGKGLHAVVTCDDPRQCMTILDQGRIETVVLDLGMPHLSGEQLLEQIAATHPEVPVIICTGSHDLDTAVRLMREGAYDYLAKPVASAPLIDAISRGVQSHRLRLPSARGFIERLQNPDAFVGFTTTSRSMIAVFQYLEAVAPSSSPVLITGETGTGKELAAKAVHRLSGRRGEFVACNLGGVDDAMFTDTLFGHRKGAFTGAHDKRAGLVERARGGTLFLDEIGDLAMASQVKLLRLLQEGEYLPMGSDQTMRADIRVVAATSQELERQLDEHRFRRDLWYRLCGHHVHLPPLRERPEDIPQLLVEFVSQSTLELGCPLPTIPEALIELIGNYAFPGNVRELKSLVHDAVSRQSGGRLALEPFKRAIGARVSVPAPNMVFPARLPTLSEIQDLLVEEALRRTNGNQAAAARLLGVTRQAMNLRVKRNRGIN
jgi:DNA-binding NtrC family response regulator